MMIIMVPEVVLLTNINIRDEIWKPLGKLNNRVGGSCSHPFSCFRFQTQCSSKSLSRLPFPSQTSSIVSVCAMMRNKQQQATDQKAIVFQPHTIQCSIFRTDVLHTDCAKSLYFIFGSMVQGFENVPKHTLKSAWSKANLVPIFGRTNGGRGFFLQTSPGLTP